MGSDSTAICSWEKASWNLDSRQASLARMKWAGAFFGWIWTAFLASIVAFG